MQPTSGGVTTPADAGTWWSFTVSAQGVYGKVAPTSSSTVLTDHVTLSWNSLPDVGYLVCWDTVNNNQCDTAWWPNGAGTSRVLESLAAGTYYWQVRAVWGGNDVEADGGIWWSFTKVTGVSGKLAPLSGTANHGSTVTLEWSAVPDSGYWVCWDTTNNDDCDTMWWPNGAATSRVLENLPNGTYYWQVKVQTGGTITEANNGAWWSFTVGSGVPPGSGTSTLNQEYIYLGSRLLASVTNGSTLTYYHTDTLGSVRAITDHTGTLVRRHEYFAFGEHTTPLNGDMRRYLGQQQDAETAFDYFGARYYRNVWGRFTGVDPVYSTGALTNPQLWNRYAYGLNGPLRYSDPSGLTPEDQPLAAGYGVSGFSAADFGAWAESLYQANMELWFDYQKEQFRTGKITFDQLLGQLPPGTVKAIRDAIKEQEGKGCNTACETGAVSVVNGVGQHEFVPLVKGPIVHGVRGGQEYCCLDITKWNGGLSQGFLDKGGPFTQGILVHVHPAASDGQGLIWEQGPSGKDLRNFASTGYRLGIVVGAGNKTVQLYDAGGLLGSATRLDDFYKKAR